jgi:endonuclease/exonuclease/phosphatase (EEP) superfamily protein YafD
VLPVALAIFLLVSGDWFGLIRALSPVRTGSRASPPTLRVVTWNIDDASGGTDAILASLEPLSPDIVVFQETPDHADFLSSASLPMTWQSWIYADAGDCGLFCRFPVSLLEAEGIGPWDKPQVPLCDWPCSQGTTIPLLLVNVRLMLPSLVLAAWDSEARALLTREHRRRRAQYESLANQIRQMTESMKPAAIILAGDFNVRGGSVSRQPLTGVAGLRDAWPLAGRGWGGTITRDFPVARIDQV